MACSCFGNASRLAYKRHIAESCHQIGTESTHTEGSGVIYAKVRGAVEDSCEHFYLRQVAALVGAEETPITYIGIVIKRYKACLWQLGLQIVRQSDAEVLIGEDDVGHVALWLILAHEVNDALFQMVQTLGDVGNKLVEICRGAFLSKSLRIHPATGRRYRLVTSGYQAGYL